MTYLQTALLHISLKGFCRGL